MKCRAVFNLVNQTTIYGDFVADTNYDEVTKLFKDEALSILSSVQYFTATVDGKDRYIMKSAVTDISIEEIDDTKF